MNKAVLQLLIANEGRYVSGGEISKVLGVSRTAIWKHIRSLKRAGYPIESSPRLGYRLLQKADILSKAELDLILQNNRFVKETLIFDAVSSTNDIASKLAAEGKPEGTLVVAESQTRGKGRMGRCWESPPQKGVSFSLILRPPISPVCASQLTFLAAVAVCRGIREHTGLPALIKWPNDIMLGNQKVCGILTELNAEIDRISYIVAGIGINVNHEQRDFSGELKAKATSLALKAKQKYRRVEIIGSIIREFAKEYRTYLQEGFASILSQWRELNVTIGREVVVSSKDEVISGIAQDVDSEGRLLVRTGEGDLRRIIAGDVSLRGKKGEYL